MNTIYIYKKCGWLLPAILLTLTLSTFTSCDDWLDVKGENIVKEQDQYTEYRGFRDALDGCYMTMASRNIYGEKMTMTDIENLACLWYVGTLVGSNNWTMVYLNEHDYNQDYSQAAIKAMYGGLFKTISSANVLMANLEENAANVGDERARKVMLGETYAIRAYCQLDVLRLFGQMPQGGTKQVKLPYSYTKEISEMPQYFDFNAYVANLKSDLEKAEGLLKENDPIMDYSYSYLNSAPEGVNELYYYRQSRLNYWAVRALHARMALYTGDNATAHSIAMEIINAKRAGTETPVITLSGDTDLKGGFYGLPSECLFYLSKYDINDYATQLLVGGQASDIFTGGFMNPGKYGLREDRLEELYASIPGATASHNRYLYEWNRTIMNSISEVTPALKKYWYDPYRVSTNTLMTKSQIIPMIRLSEMYLIAIETSNSLAEAQQLYDTYMTSCEFKLYEPFASLELARAEMVNEYRREFFGEGQMFYVYKRRGIMDMMWSPKEVTEDTYLVPLPATEYDPALIRK